MKELALFLIIVLAISIASVALPHFNVNGIQIQKTFAGLSSSLDFSFDPLPEEKIEEEKSGKIIENRKEPPKQKENTKPNPRKEVNYIKLRISGISKSSYYNPSLITLSYSSGEEKTNITGWKIKTRKGEFIIPQGIETYNYYISEKDIFANKYDTIYLIGAQSPLGRKSFKINKCFGYLSNLYEFYPYIWNSCPSPLKITDISLQSPVCQDFLRYFYGCEAPDYSNKLEIATDSACVEYINRHFSYSGCFNDFSSDQDFLQNYWYVYTNSNLVDPLHDTIYLYDRSGNLVSEYSY